jgi:hypothetical protein
MYEGDLLSILKCLAVKTKLSPINESKPHSISSDILRSSHDPCLSHHTTAQRLYIICCEIFVISLLSFDELEKKILLHYRDIR